MKIIKFNKYVEVDYLKENNIEYIFNNIVDNYNVNVVSEILPIIYIIKLIEIYGKNNICFICGLASFIFTDFAHSTIYDEEYYKKIIFYKK